jgi:hypothetical protein
VRAIGGGDFAPRASRRYIFDVSGQIILGVRDKFAHYLSASGKPPKHSSQTLNQWFFLRRANLQGRLEMP